MNSSRQNFIAIFICYFIWGILPMYFSLLHQLPTVQIIIYRIIFSAIFMILLILTLRKYNETKLEIQQLLASPLTIFYIISASFLITINWFTYVIAIQQHKVLEASFGYYLTPIVTIILAVIFLKERLSRLQIFACLWVSAALVYLLCYLGKLPWIALSLAISFGLYSLCKKQINLSITTGLLLETLIISPLAIIYLISQPMFALSQLNTISLIAWLLLGIMTAVPLLLFAKAAQNIPLYLIGILQYMPPTLQFILGIVIYQEQLNTQLLIAFIFIWIGVLVFCYSAIKQHQK